MPSQHCFLYLSNGWSPAKLIRPRVVGAIPNEEFPAGDPTVLGGELSTPPNIKQAHFAAPHCHLQLHLVSAVLYLFTYE